MIAFQPLRSEDLPLLAEWLRRSPVREGWREPKAASATSATSKRRGNRIA